jgi:hypothetical protein
MCSDLIFSIISIMSASYYSEVNQHGFAKLFKFCSMRNCTLRLSLDGAFCGATEREYKCENIIDFINENLES